MGQIKETNSHLFHTAQRLVKFLCHPNPIYRSSALTSILGLVTGMDASYGTAIVWIALPLYADPCPTIRSIFARFQKNIPDLIDAYCQITLPHADDNFVLPTCSWSEDLVDNATLSVSQKFLNDINMEIDALIMHPFKIKPVMFANFRRWMTTICFCPWSLRS